MPRKIAVADGREFLKSNWERLAGFVTDQKKGEPQPPVQRPSDKCLSIIDLPKPDKLGITTDPLLDVIERRRSRRHFSADELSLEELSYLLWTTQGVRETLAKTAITKRTVPSAGSRHPLETYLSIHRVHGLPQGMYRYLPVGHRLCHLFPGDNRDRLVEACLGQEFVRQSAVTFVWTAVPYRTEWRYAMNAHKVILLDAGHVCQNLYLAAESIGCGTCAIGAYSQESVDDLIGVDGKDEFAVYLAPVGRLE
jgi:SagB-type dehydrogenase family enzyme